MRYGTTVQSPIQHRFLGQTTPKKAKQMVTLVSVCLSWIRFRGTVSCLHWPVHSVSSSMPPPALPVAAASASSTVGVALLGPSPLSQLQRLVTSGFTTFLSDWRFICFMLCWPLQAPTVQTLGGFKPPHPGFGGYNKENKGQPNGTPPCTQRNVSMASIASTYSEFVVKKPFFLS